MGEDIEGQSEQPPNIILIMVDDMGFSDIGCFGSEIPTPHLDALAAGGLKFSQFYNTAQNGLLSDSGKSFDRSYSHQVVTVG